MAEQNVHSIASKWNHFMWCCLILDGWFTDPLVDLLIVFEL